MTRFKRHTTTIAYAAVVCLIAVPATAQTTPGAGASRGTLWLQAGGSSTTVRGDCQTCEEDYPYRHTGSLFADIGRHVNDRMDAGVEVFWTGMGTASGRIRATHIDGIAQFRPWASTGFFVRGGAGMAFIRNWVELIGPDAINSKALSVVIGAGWEFRTKSRARLQLLAAQHATAIGDLQTAEGQVPDVIANSWSLGAALVIR